MRGYGERTPIGQATIVCLHPAQQEAAASTTFKRPPPERAATAGGPVAAISHADGQNGRRVCTPTALRNPKWSASTLEIGPEWPPGSPGRARQRSEEPSGHAKVHTRRPF